MRIYTSIITQAQKLHVSIPLELYLWNSWKNLYNNHEHYCSLFKRKTKTYRKNETNDRNNKPSTESDIDASDNIELNPQSTKMPATLN